MIDHSELLRRLGLDGRAGFPHANLLDRSEAATAIETLTRELAEVKKEAQDMALRCLAADRQADAMMRELTATKARLGEARQTAKDALTYILDEAEKRKYGPSAPLMLVADLEDVITKEPIQ
jgi:DNA gyrase/topoisomerase IV subunit A